MTVRKPGSLAEQIDRHLSQPADFPLEYTAWLRRFITEPTNYQQGGPTGGGSSGVFFNSANTTVSGRSLAVAANQHNTSIAFPGTSNKPGVALTSSDSYGMLLETSGSGAELRLVTDGTTGGIRAQIAAASTGFFLVESGGTMLFEVDGDKSLFMSFLTAIGDLPYASATTGKLARRAIGSTGQALTVSGGVPTWAASATSVLTTTGDLLYASAANTLARRAIGSTGNVLTVAGGVPTWAAPAGLQYGTNNGGGLTINSTGNITVDSDIIATLNGDTAVVISSGSVVIGLDPTNADTRLGNGSTFTVTDHLGNLMLKMTDGSANLHIKTGGTVIADL